MSVGGHIIEIQPMVITAGSHPGVPTPVKRLWCMDRSGDETCVYAEDYGAGDGPVVGDEVWWQAGRIFFDQDRRTVRKVGYSFSPFDH